jgi:leucyl/phenylalanyl-tRNA---protein transferase
MIPVLLHPESPADAWPDPRRALREPDGLVAIGGDLSTARLLSAYRHGLFPWYSVGDPILWWCPSVRMVFDACHVHVGRTLRCRLRTAGFEYSRDKAFPEVIAACADRPGRGTWITPDMQAAYIALHRAGYAHSMEVWLGDKLVGGLYGIALGRVFFGESMFSRVDDASKAALVRLADDLKATGYTMIDGQLPNPHLQTLGAVTMDRDAFLDRIAGEVE